MKREYLILGFIVQLFAWSSFTIPSSATTVAEASNDAEAVVAAEAGPNEFDDLPEGKVLKLKSSRDFALRKQQYKVLKVYKNTSKVKLSVADKLWIPPRGSVCFQYPASVKKEKGKLKLTTSMWSGGRLKPDVSFDEVAKPEKKILFLRAVVTGKHVDWYHSEFPLQFSEEAQKEIDALATKPAQTKKVVQIGSECNDVGKSKSENSK